MGIDSKVWQIRREGRWKYSLPVLIIVPILGAVSRDQLLLVASTILFLPFIAGLALALLLTIVGILIRWVGIVKGGWKLAFLIWYYYLRILGTITYLAVEAVRRPIRSLLSKIPPLMVPEEREGWEGGEFLD